MNDQINLSEWYNPSQAAERLSRNSGKPIDISYVHTLARYGKIATFQISPRMRLYRKVDVDNYIVEKRGDKSGRAKRQQAKAKTKKQENAA